jgi:pimeloyl-ACP methyl ester carboxylesterase
MIEKPLLDDGFRLIALNRPGYYGTPLSCGRSPDDSADLGAELLRELGIERAVIIGTSGGGPSACRLAARHPQTTAALVLQCALAHPFDSRQWMPPNLGLLLPLFRHIRFFMPVLRFGHRQQIRKLARKTFVSQCMSKERFAELRDSPELHSLGRLLADSMIRCYGQQPAGTENDWVAWTGDPWLTPLSVECPTLILHDRADAVVPFAHAEWAMRCISAGELCEVDTGGHLIWVGKDRERLRRVRTKFIKRHFGNNRVS